MHDEKPDDAPADAVGARYGLANSLPEAGQLREAQVEYEIVLERGPEVFGEGHPKLLTVQMMIADCHAEVGDLEEAVRLYAEIGPRTKEHFGTNHPSSIVRSNNWAFYLGKLGRYEEAESLWRDVCAAAEECYGSSGVQLAGYLASHGHCLFDQKKYAESIPLRKRAELIYEEKLGAEDLKTKEARLEWLTSCRMAEESLSEEQGQEAYRLMREVLSIDKKEAD